MKTGRDIRACFATFLVSALAVSGSAFADGDFCFEVASYPGVSRKVTVDGEVRHEGSDYFEARIPNGSKVEVTAAIADGRFLFDDLSAEKTFVWDSLDRNDGVGDEIRPYGADWIILRNTLGGTPPEDLRGALTCTDVGGTNVVALLRDVSTVSQYDLSLVVTNASVLDLAGHDVSCGSLVNGVIDVGARRSTEAGPCYVPGWLKIVDSVGGGVITQAGGQGHGHGAAGGISVLPESVCVMDGGVITACFGTEAGGVYNAGTFVLTGGEIVGNVAAYDSARDSIVNGPDAELVVKGGKVRDGICDENPAGVAISGGYFGAGTTLDRAWIVDGFEAVPSDEFTGYDRRVIPTPPDVAAARTNAWNEIEKAAGPPMFRSDEMDGLVAEAKESVRRAYPAENVAKVLADCLETVGARYAKDNVVVSKPVTVAGALDLRSRRELPHGVDVVTNMTYSDTLWGGVGTSGDVTIRQQNLETGRKMTVVEGLRGSSEGTAIRLIGQDTDETGLGHRLSLAVGDAVLDSFVTFSFDGFEPGVPSNPWSVGGNVTAYLSDEGTLVIGGTGAMDDFASAADAPWAGVTDRVSAVTVADGVTHVGRNAFAGIPDGVTVNGVRSSFYRMMGGAYGMSSGQSAAGAISGAEFESVEIVGGKAYLGVSVYTNASLEVEKAGEGGDGGWGVAANGVIEVPAPGKQGFFILRSKPAAVSDAPHAPIFIPEIVE